MTAYRVSLVALTASLVWVAAAPAIHAQEADDDEAVEAIVVEATRSGHLLQDEPIRVEVVPREEIDEKVLMSPGNIAMLVNETGGVRLQVTSPALGSARIRVQGMRGRYTQLLADGLPLYGGSAGSLGLLQVPPTDLGQVEVIKGAASALYGPAALGGVINLVSRRPATDPLAEVLFNATSREGQDLTAYASAPFGAQWSGSVVGGYHRQSIKDLDRDGWLDIPGYERWTLRPRLFWEGGGGARAFLTLGAMDESRAGGTAPGRTAPDGQPFAQTQDSRRFDAGLVAQLPLGGALVGHLRAAGMTQKDDRRFGTSVQNDRQGTLFAEGSVSLDRDGTSLLVGAALQSDTFRSRSFPRFDYTYTVPALFVQAEHELGEALTLAGSARLDRHSEYGARLSPRLSALWRPGPWSVRASVGGGFYAPTPFVEEIEAAGLARLEPLNGLKAETAETASLDGGYMAGPFEVHVTVFASNIRDAVRLEETGPASVRLINAPGATRTHGAELALRYRWGDLFINGSYVYTDAREPDLSGGRRTVPQTPRHTGGIDTMWETPKGRIGFEAYYTGRQSLEDNPYRATGKAYLQLGLMGEVVLGKVRLFLNLENLLDIRQTKYDPLVLPRRSAEGGWTTDVWAPTDGFVANAGVRLKFGG
jgi:iron complex outermembrane receptor protein